MIGSIKTWGAALTLAGSLGVAGWSRAQGASSQASLRGNAFDWARAQDVSETTCGLITVEAMDRYLKDKPSLDALGNIERVARSKGLYDASAGMHGTDAEAALLEARGIHVTVEKDVASAGEPGRLKALQRKIVALLDAGKPVIVATDQHYYFVEGFARDGRLFVGHTGEAMVWHVAHYGLATTAGAHMWLEALLYAGNVPPGGTSSTADILYPEDSQGSSASH